MIEQEEIAQEWAWMWIHGCHRIRIDNEGISFIYEVPHQYPHGNMIGFTFTWKKHEFKKQGVYVSKERNAQMSMDEKWSDIIKRGVNTND